MGQTSNLIQIKTKPIQKPSNEQSEFYKRDQYGEDPLCTSIMSI